MPACLPTCLPTCPPAADSSWAGGSVAPNADGGLQLVTHSDMLGLDAAVLTIQLNLRQLLEVRCNVACSLPACLPA